MTEDSNDEHEIEHRIEWRMVAIALAGVIVGAVGWDRYKGDPKLDPHPKPASELRVRQLIVEDSGGRPRIVMHERKGVAGAAVLDAAGTERLLLSTDEEGIASVLVKDATATTRINIKTNPDGQAMVSLYDPEGIRRITMAAMPDGTAAIEAYRRDGTSEGFIEAKD